MAEYVWGYHPRAKADLDAAVQVYGERLRDDIEKWHASVASFAAAGRELSGGPGEPEGVSSRLLRAWLRRGEPSIESGLLAALGEFFQKPRQAPDRPRHEYWVTEIRDLDVAGCFHQIITTYFIVEEDPTPEQEPARVTFLRFVNLP